MEINKFSYLTLLRKRSHSLVEQICEQKDNFHNFIFTIDKKCIPDINESYSKHENTIHPIKPNLS